MEIKEEIAINIYDNEPGVKSEYIWKCQKENYLDRANELLKLLAKEGYGKVIDKEEWHKIGMDTMHYNVISSFQPIQIEEE